MRPPDARLLSDKAATEKERCSNYRQLMDAHFTLLTINNLRSVGMVGLLMSTPTLRVPNQSFLHILRRAKNPDRRQLAPTSPPYPRTPQSDSNPPSHVQDATTLSSGRVFTELLNQSFAHNARSDSGRGAIL